MNDFYMDELGNWDFEVEYPDVEEDNYTDSASIVQEIKINLTTSEWE